jgi:aminopeptidase YwaD
LRERIEAYLRELVSFPDRHVGGPGNQAATALFAEQLKNFGFAVTLRSFDCIEWEYGEAEVDIDGELLEAYVGPHSLPCEVTARLTCATAVEQLETDGIRGTVVLIHGELASGQVMPKNFTFYNPESHRRIVRALEDHRPVAIVAATGRDPGMVGSQYPFPLFEDGDLDIPNAYLKDVDGVRLRAHEGEPIRVSIDSRRILTTAEHVVGTLAGSGSGRIVVFAHIDSGKGSPGALDDASGVATLLALAELHSESYRGAASIEIVPFNGEDNYANPGEMLWVAENEGRFDEVILGINIDDLGMRGTDNHVSFYGCPPDVEAAVRGVMGEHPSVQEGPQWFQSDHAILTQYGRPAIAMASSDIAGFMAKYAHSDRDTLELADLGLISAAAYFLREVVEVVARLGHE